MKRDFTDTMKTLRMELHPIFVSIDGSKGDDMNAKFELIETKKTQMLEQAGWTNEEFDALISEHFMDFSSENPEEWIIRHDPEHPGIVLKSGKTA